MKKYFLAIIFPLALTACKNNAQNSDKVSGENPTATTAVANIPYTVVNVYPHDATYFTEGFFLKDGNIYEGTGENGKSKVIIYDLKTGKVAKSIAIPSQYFGEGINIIGNKLYELTWQSHKVFVYDLPNLNKVREMTWPNQGWGMTNDGKNLIISTGSSNLYFVNPEDFKVVKTLNVTNNYGPLSNINELEYVDGYIYANVWETDNIVKIDLNSGKVVGMLDLSDIRQKNGVPVVEENVLNGIAFDSAKNTLLVTGKNWPKTFELKLN